MGSGSTTWVRCRHRDRPWLLSVTPVGMGSVVISFPVPRSRLRLAPTRVCSCLPRARPLRLPSPLSLPAGGNPPDCRLDERFVTTRSRWTGSISRSLLAHVESAVQATGMGLPQCVCVCVRPCVSVGVDVCNCACDLADLPQELLCGNTFIQTSVLSVSQTLSLQQGNSPTMASMLHYIRINMPTGN